MSNLINNALMTSGVFRALVIKRNDIRVYVPGMMNENIIPDGQLDESKYELIKHTLPKAIFNSEALKNVIGTEPTPCWIVFENGDTTKASVVGFLGAGVPSVPNRIGGVGGAGSGGSAGASGGSASGGSSGAGNGDNININGVGDILLVAGHGNGDPGACSGNYQEATLTREVVNALASKIKCDVYDTSKNMFKDLSGSAATEYLKKYKVVMEVHFNATPGGHGSELLVRNPGSPTNLESAILNSLTSVGFTNRGFKDGNWLGNMKKAINAGVQNYFLVEMCFIDSASDMSLYQSKKDTIISNFAKVFNGSVSNSSDYGDWKLLGNDFVITHYCIENYPHICNDGDASTTATGTTPTPGRTIAVDPTIIPYGTHVKINNHEYIAEDTGSAIKGHRIDIVVDTHANALNKGRLTGVSVYVKK